MLLQDFMKAFDYRIVGGSEYQWETFGDNARWLDFESEYANGSVIYDCKNQTVYQAEVCANSGPGENKPYRWTNPAYKDSYIQECSQKNIVFNCAWDDIHFTDLELVEDFFEKANAIFNGESYDDRVIVPLDLDNDTILQLALMAHKRDVTINKMVEIVLQTAIDKLKSTEVIG